MRRRSNRRNHILPFILVLVLAAALAPATALARRPLWFSPPKVEPTQVIYDSTVTPLPQHLPSEAFESTSTSEFGDEVTFAGTSRALQQATVTLVSWACEFGFYKDGNCVTNPGATFSVPITFNIYNVGSNDAVGALLATRTQTFDIPYQPSRDVGTCDAAPDYGFFNTKTGSCTNGIDANITFDFGSMAVTLPDSVIYGISFNTTSFGPKPLGTETACFSVDTGCPYDSLNVAVSPEVVVGSQAYPGKAFLDSTWTGAYCDSGTAGTGSFRLDSPGDAPEDACWTGYVPAVQFTAGTPPATGQLAWLYNFVRQFYANYGRFGGFGQ